ncbi:MAG: transglycosylase SLT domain-containing protein [bacterium]|nr:transglycosylase SLT domain-containing protein [bacterium]
MMPQDKKSGGSFLHTYRYIKIPSLLFIFSFLTMMAFAGGSIYWIFKKDNEIEKFRRLEIDLQNQIKERDRTLQQNKQKIEQLERRVEIFNAIDELSRADLSEPDKWKIAKFVDEESQKYNHDPLLLIAMMDTESSLQPNAISEQGAHGLMQIMPGTGKHLSKEIAENPKLIGLLDDTFPEPQNIREIEGNIRIGTLYLTKLLMTYKNLEDAFCAYNMGPNRFEQLKKEGKAIPRTYPNKILSKYNQLSQKRNGPSSHIPRVFTPETPNPLLAQLPK